MTGREWVPGDLVDAQWAFLDAHRYVRVSASECSRDHGEADHWHSVTGTNWASTVESSGNYRPLVVIDPEDREQVERLARATHESDHIAPWHDLHNETRSQIEDAMYDALREFANPTPEEPANPKARVTDRRENIWRLLADGDWVCTSGPDIGEYLVWWQLAERGPLTVEVYA